MDSSSFMQAAVVLISDTSSVGGDFLCIYQKPFITLPVPFENMQEFEIEDLKTSWKEEVLAKIGYTVNNDEIEKIEQIVYFLIANHKKRDLAGFGETDIYSFGNFGKVIAGYLIQNSSLNK